MPIQVCVRTRPTARFADHAIQVHDDRKTLTVRLPKADNPNAQDAWTWRFDGVLHNASQETLYHEQVAPLVADVLRGVNGTVLCYGQTGAGKTFTQLGSTDHYHNRGVIPRALAHLFSHLQEHPQLEASVRASYVEIHNDALVDLLAALPSEAPPAEALHLFEDKAGATHVKGLRCEEVRSEEEALHLLFEGQNHRAVAHHQLNKHSTRGHSVFTLHLRVRSRVESSGVVKVSKLHLVDLAGSERLKKTDTMGELRAESMYINRSLSYLEQVVVALSSKGRAHTPYRQSKLTFLLKDSLGGNCKTLLIANVYGEEQHLEETVSTLQFAARVRLVPNEATVNQQEDPELLIKKYAAQVADLKRELAMHDSLASRSGVSYEPYSEQQRFALMQQLQSFLEWQTDTIELESVRQMREMLSAARVLFDRQKAELEESKRLLASGATLPSGTDAAAPAGVSSGAEEGVGRALPESGIPIGKAAAGARPAGGVVEAGGGGGMLSASDAPSAGGGGGGGGGGGEPPMDKQAAFAQFKESEGFGFAQRLLQAKRDVKEHRARRAGLAAAVNEAKRQIDELKARLEAKKAERQAVAAASGEEVDIIDEEEYALLQQVKAARRAYKEAHEELLSCNAALEACSAEADTARQELLKSFDEWYDQSFTPGPAVEAEEEEEAVGGGDAMDDDEQFEQLRMTRVMQEEPESLAFVRARHSVRKGAKKR